MKTSIFILCVTRAESLWFARFCIMFISSDSSAVPKMIPTTPKTHPRPCSCPSVPSAFGGVMTWSNSTLPLRIGVMSDIPEVRSIQTITVIISPL